MEVVGLVLELAQPSEGWGIDRVAVGAVPIVYAWNIKQCCARGQWESLQNFVYIWDEMMEIWLTFCCDIPAQDLPHCPKSHLFTIEIDYLIARVST
jgi:hypothetical protein